MKRRLGFLLLAICGIIFCGACIPDELPAWTNQGRTIVALDKDAAQVWTHDLKTGASGRHKPADTWKPYQAMMLGGQMWLLGADPKADDPKELIARRFDPSTGKFTPPPAGIHSERLVRRTFAASHKGKTCLFMVGEEGTQVLSLPDLKKQATLATAPRRPAGHFWWLQIAYRTDDDGDNRIDRIDVYDARTRKQCAISGAEARKADADETGNLMYSRVSRDGKLLLLAFGGRGPETFGVFDTATGKCLWSARAEEYLVGSPVIRRNEVWTLERVAGKAPTTAPAGDTGKRPELDHVGLIRHSPGPDGKGKREIILHYPALPDMKIDHFSPSPDNSQFVMQVTGQTSSRLLLIPIRKDATAKDVRVIELKEPRPTTQPAKSP